MELTSLPLIGIGLAVASAAAVAVGNLLQGRGVRDMERRAAQDVPGAKVTPGRKAFALVHEHIWLFGSLLLVVAILLQMGSLTFAPLMVVQPVGVSALLFTVLLTSLADKRMPSRSVLRAIALCVVGVAAFVTVASMVSTQTTITDAQLIAVLVVLGGVLAGTGVLWAVARRRPAPAILWVVLGGVYSAFVVTLGKTVILRVQTMLHHRSFTVDLANTLTLVCIAAIAVAGALSVYFVQKAHATNRTEVVVAGLTIIDPAVAVVLGITILQEASTAPLWSIFAFAGAGAVAVGGVLALSRAENAESR